jgi:hypothetical protein
MGILLRSVPRKIANQCRQDDTLQTYLHQIGRLLLDKDRPLRQSAEVGSEARTLARAWTLTVLPRLDAGRKGSAVQFLYETGLITTGRLGVETKGADLSEAFLRKAFLNLADLSGAVLYGALQQLA